MKESVVELKEIKGPYGMEQQANDYLKLGWKLIETWVCGAGYPHERQEKVHLLLGWVDNSQSPIHPPTPEPEPDTDPDLKDIPF